MHQRRVADETDDAILDEEEQEAIISGLHKHRLFIVTSVVLATLLLVLYTQFSEKSPAAILSCFLVAFCYVAQAVSMIQQPPVSRDDPKLTKQLPTQMWWPPKYSPSTRALWFSVSSALFLCAWWTTEVLKWPLNAILGILLFHTFAVQNVHLGFVSGAEAVADLKLQRYSYKRV